ncbi:MAG: TonB family protein [Deltaproteobacteria bacterium]|nr:TonB family protein [Deltaproteobacteria bacterium]
MKQIISLFLLLTVLVLLTDCNNRTHFNNYLNNPPPAIQYAGQGNTLTNNKKYDEAISYFNKAINLEPNNSMYYCNRGEAYWLNGQNNEAMADFNRSIELDPNIANGYFYRGAVYMKDEEVDKAIIEFNMAIQKNPDFAPAYLYRGIAFEKTGEINKAVLDKKRAKELQPRVEAVLKRMISPEIDEPVDPDTIYTLSEVEAPPKAVYVVPPVYPIEAKKNNISGYVKVKYVVTKEGKTKDIIIKEASPKGVFETAAIQAVEQYRFNPAVKKGQAVNVIVNMPIQFDVNTK